MASYVERFDFLGDTLTQYREANFLSQKDIADIIGVSRSTYSYYELGKIEPSVQTLSKLAKIYDISIVEFLPPENTLNSMFSDSGDIFSKHPQQKDKNSNMGDLNHDEKILIAKFRVADIKLQRAILIKLNEYIDELNKEDK